MQGGLDPIADRVGVLDRHLGGHHEMELDERHAAGTAGAHVVRLDRAFGVLRDQLAQFGDLLGVGDLVHESADGFPQDAVTGPENVQRDQAGDGRVEA